MSHLRVEDLIADLSDDGILHSTGGFTLDPSKAEEKLKNFAMVNPGDYILKALQFAVASAASSIHLRVLPTKIELIFDGEPVSQTHLKEMMAHLVTERQDPTNRRFRHLAAAMRGALSAQPTSVLFESWDGLQGWSRKWDKRGWRVEQLSRTASGTVSHRFLVKRSFLQSFDSATSELGAFFSGKGLTAEEQTLVGYTQRCPVVIHLDGKPLPSHEFGKARYLGYEIAQDPNPGEMKPPPYLDTSALRAGCYDPAHHLIEACYPSAPECPTSLPVPPTQATQRKGLQPGDSGNCRAWIAVSAALDAPRLTVVCDGVELWDRECSPDFGLGTRIILAGEMFNTDLTGLQIVEDSTFQNTIDWARAEAQKLRQEIRDSLYLYPKPEWLEVSL